MMKKITKSDEIKRKNNTTKGLAIVSYHLGQNQNLTYNNHLDLPLVIWMFSKAIYMI